MPLGWLWASTTAVAPKARASVAIFRRLISLALGLPSLSSRTPRSFSFPFEAGQKGHLISGPKEVGEKQGAQAGAVGDDHVGAGSGRPGTGRQRRG